MTPEPVGLRGSGYAALSRQVRQSGLLDRRPRHHAWKIRLTAAALAAGWTTRRSSPRSASSDTTPGTARLPHPARQHGTDRARHRVRLQPDPSGASEPGIAAPRPGPREGPADHQCPDACRRLRHREVSLNPAAPPGDAQQQSVAGEGAPAVH
jgi:hypothetical protein